MGVEEGQVGEWGLVSRLEEQWRVEEAECCVEEGVQADGQGERGEEVGEMKTVQQEEDMQL